MQLSRHGSLESTILSVLWKLEKRGIYKNSVKDVWETMAQSDSEKRAYTTVKTVMDRLYEKKALIRFKDGKRFYYRTTYTNLEAIYNCLHDIANRYCGGDLIELAEAVNSLIGKNALTRV